MSQEVMAERGRLRLLEVGVAGHDSRCVTLGEIGQRQGEANAWARYRFSGDRLKGLALAGGARYQSKNVAGVDLLTNTPLYGNDRLLFDAMIQYRTRGLFGLFAAKTAVSYQLNLENILDVRTIYITKAALDDITRTRYIRRGFREDPRNFSLTVRLDF
jgi:outer membrane receptor for monomeric catechols